MKKALLTLATILVTLTVPAQEVLKCDTILKDGKMYVRKTVQEFADGRKIVTDSLFSDGSFLTTTQTHWFAYEGQPMPDFVIKTEDGAVITSESLRGKTVVISFWISTCGPCLKELNRVGSELIDVLPKDKFAFLAIGSGETAEAAKSFHERSGATFPLCYDESGEVVKLFADQGFPKVFVIDRDGIIRHTEKGYNDEKFALLKQTVFELISNDSTCIMLRSKRQNQDVNIPIKRFDPYKEKFKNLNIVDGVRPIINK